MVQYRALLGSNPSTVKSHNLRAILLTLLREQPISRVSLAERLGLSSTTVTNLVAELLDQGIVAEEGVEVPAQRRAGRPRMALRLVPNARYAIGVHIGVGNVRVALTGLCARPVSYLVQGFDLDRSPEAVIGDVAELVERAMRNVRVHPGRVVGIGVGASGLVDPVSGVNWTAPNLGWHHVPLRDLLAGHTDLPIHVDNNVRAMAFGESMIGYGQNAHAMAFVYARIGVGAGLVVGGQLFRGSGAGAGEIGHITIVADDGMPCRCGNTGCLETLVSETTIVSLAQEIAQREPDGILASYLCQHDRTDDSPLESIFAAARAGDTTTRQMLQQRARYMGIALANLVNVFNPSLIVLGGIFQQAQDLFLPVTERVMRQRAFADLGERVQLHTTRFGRQAGVIGAAALALDAFFYQQADGASPTRAQKSDDTR